MSLFSDPEPDTIRRAADLGADRVELYTGPYAWAHIAGDASYEIDRHAAAAEAAHEVGIALNAGHDLDLRNLPDFLAAVPGVQEVSIGQALMADALHMGLREAVSAYLNTIGDEES